MSIELMFEGRCVQGHAVHRNNIIDDDGDKVLDESGAVKTQTYMALAVPKKTGESDWKQTEWGQKIVQVAVGGYPNGEINRPDFSWKIEDGDSQIPNKRGKKNCDREGFPGNWIVKFSTQLNVQCYPYQKYTPADIISDPKMVKTGDYFIVYASIADNTNNGTPAKSPGVYINPKVFVFTRAGTEIISESAVDVAAVMANVVSTTATEQGATQPPTPGAIPPPANDLIRQPGNAGEPPIPPAQPPEDKFIYQGTVYTKTQLLGWNWSEEQINSLSKAV